MSHKNILFICEGENDEKLLNVILKTYKLNTHFEIYKYKTNIHIFAKHLFQNYSFSENDIREENVDIIQVLKEF